MTKKTKEKNVNISGKPKHSLDANRTDGKNGSRSAATVRRLKMYNTRPKRNRSGKILKNDFQSKELPNTRIQPDRRWFGKIYLYIYAHAHLYNRSLEYYFLVIYYFSLIFLEDVLHL